MRPAFAKRPAETGCEGWNGPLAARIGNAALEQDRAGLVVGNQEQEGPIDRGSAPTSSGRMVRVVMTTAVAAAASVPASGDVDHRAMHDLVDRSIAASARGLPVRPGEVRLRSGRTLCSCRGS